MQRIWDSIVIWMMVAPVVGFLGLTLVVAVILCLIIIHLDGKETDGRK